MDRHTRRQLRRFFRESRGPAAYVALLAVTLTAFLISMRSCAVREPPPGPSEVRVVREPV